MPAEIIVFPDFEKLQTEVQKLRTELSMLVLERDDLRFTECRNIEMTYMLKLGALEYKAFETQCAFLRLRRKLEMIQARLNRQERIDIQAIESSLDTEFADFQEKLNEQISRMNDAIERSHSEFLSADDAAELKKLYRRIVKALHPDLHPDISEEKIALFDNAVKAYERGDLTALRIIDAMVSESPLPEAHEDAMQELIKERDRLKALLDSIRNSIERIKSEYPYTMKELISDEQKITLRREELEDIIEQYNEAISIYNARIKELLG